MALHEVAGIELHAGQGGLHRHGNAGGGARHLGQRAQAVRTGGGVQREVVVIASGDGQLGAVLPNALANGVGLGEVKGSVFHCRQFAGGDERLVHRGVAAGKQAQPVGHHSLGARVLASQVPVGVAGEGGGAGFVRFGFPFQGETILQQLPAHRQLQLAGIALVAVGAGEAQLQQVVLRSHKAEHPGVEALHAAVQVILAVVAGQLIVLAVQCEAAFGDPVGHPPHKNAQVVRAGKVGGRVIVVHQNFHRLALRAGHCHPLQGGATVQHREGDPALFQRVAVDGRAVRQGEKQFFRHRHGCSPLFRSVVFG